MSRKVLQHEVCRVSGFSPQHYRSLAIMQATQNIEIEMHGKGGHSMVPPRDGSSVVARMSRIVQAVETKLPPPKLYRPTSELLKSVGSVADSSFVRMLLSNCERW